ncbi:MAG TPA: hypothetical protein VN794_18785 [Methylomirabilota bacterium]|nr:hypothetical protein [Methylomirabilota bacterium]
MSYAPHANKLLFILRAGNMQSTSDQPFSKIGNFANFMITGITAMRVTGATSVLCLGGVYSGAAKSGNTLVSNLQSWLGLSGPGKIVQATLANSATTDAQTATPIFSLSTGSTAACTADVYIHGVPLDS